MTELSDQLKELGKRPTLKKVFFSELEVGQVFYTSSTVTPFERFTVKLHKGNKVGQDNSNVTTLRLYDTSQVYIPE